LPAGHCHMSPMTQPVRIVTVTYNSADVIGTLLGSVPERHGDPRA